MRKCQQALNQREMWMVNGKLENFIFVLNWNLSNSVNFYDNDYYYRGVSVRLYTDP